ncbi:MAG: ABC transporter ATP-binding protein [Acidiferrobacterales bacterium]|nr:ABC transporter ATP-binding protein [Acidiferrobacterales bacterium]
MSEQSPMHPVAVMVNMATKVFGEGDESVTALDSVNLDIKENEFFTLLGPSGCGKTTLLRLIAGFEHPTSGSILLYDQDITFLPPYQRPVNTVFQNYALFPHMTVRQNVSFGLEMLGKAKSEIAETVDSVLNLVRMEELANRRTSEISGGQQQRVALARALAPRPKVLLLDESLSALDYKLRQDMQLELKRLQHETGITFIFVTHDQEEALTMSDRLAVMNNGQVLQVGSPGDIYNHPKKRFVAEFIGDSNFLKADVTSVTDRLVSIRFDTGKVFSVPAVPDLRADTKVTVTVRPEQTTLNNSLQDATFTGVIRNIVYLGTHTNYIIELSDGTEFTAHIQNLSGREKQFEIGGEVGITLDPSAMQVMKD